MRLRSSGRLESSTGEGRYSVLETGTGGVSEIYIEMVRLPPSPSPIKLLENLSSQFCPYPHLHPQEETGEFPSCETEWPLRKDLQILLGNHP